jgi:hypothetical protein
VAEYGLVRSRRKQRQRGHIEVWGLSGIPLLTAVLNGGRRPFMLGNGARLVPEQSTGREIPLRNSGNQKCQAHRSAAGFFSPTCRS